MPSKRTALVYPFRFGTFESDWAMLVSWLLVALHEKGFEILKHKDVKFWNSPDERSARLEKFDGDFDPEEDKDKKIDLVIYNHCDIHEINQQTDKIKSDYKWIFKPTPPTETHVTLDELGFGSYSSITYDKPDFEDIPQDVVDNFFESSVDMWINLKSSKWGENYFGIDSDLEEDDFYLILWQCGGDSVVNRQDFGSYFDKVEAIIRELDKVDDRPIVVKLHPYTNGQSSDVIHSVDWVEHFTKKFTSINPDKIKIYSNFSSVHEFIPRARCVFVGNSGAGYEVMMHSKPMVSFCYPEYHWITYDLRKVCDISNAIKVEEWFNPDLSDRFLYWFSEKYCYYDLDTARKRVDDLLEENIIRVVKFL